MTDYLPGSIKHLNILLGEQLTEGEGGGGGETWETVFEGSVTTEVEGGAPFAEGNIEGLTNLSADSIKVTFNGTEYECNKIVQGGNNIYGGVGEDGPEFSQYPFTIMSSEGNGTLFFTQTAGTYTLKIEEPQSGGSVFSTVTVTVDNPQMYADASMRGCFYTETPTATSTALIPAQSGTYDIILYKGNGILDMILGSSRTATVTGNAESMGGDSYIITGDCTITIS